MWAPLSLEEFGEADFALDVWIRSFSLPHCCCHIQTCHCCNISVFDMHDTVMMALACSKVLPSRVGSGPEWNWRPVIPLPLGTVVTYLPKRDMEVAPYKASMLKASLTVLRHLQVANKAYDYYTSYTGVKLPLPKLDMVAVPGRRHAEPHWGLALFDERRLLYNKVIAAATPSFSNGSNGHGVSSNFDRGGHRAAARGVRWGLALFDERCLLYNKGVRIQDTGSKYA